MQKAVFCEMACRADPELKPQSFKITALSEQIHNLEEDESTLHVKDSEPDPIPDGTLQVEGEIFYVNRQRLALQSPYFRALFFGCGIESTKRRVEIKGVAVKHFRVLMEYSRKSNLALDRENVLGILETADFLQLERARLLCCKFLERELHLSNCLGMMAYAWRLGCTQLYKAARQVVLSHFPAIVAEEDFLSLSKETIADLLASDDLAIHKDDLALEAILRWASFDPKRKEHFLELIELVRPESLSLPFITDLLTRMKSSDPRAKLICMLNEHFPAAWSMGRSMTRTRARETLFVLGGPHDQEQQALYQFHPLSGRWQSCAPLQRKNLTQYSVAAVGLDTVLYVLGGSMDEGLVVDVERLVLGSEEGWEEVSSMDTAVERAATAALGSNIYVACGLDENGEAYGGIQRYMTKEDQWDVISYSPFPRYDLVATELNGALYLFGGQALRFDVETDEWTVLEEDCLDRKFFSGCTTVSSQIYLVGERKSNKAFPNMILMDPYIDTCIEVDDAIPCPVPLRGCVTMKNVA
uniref:BTB domain-containing protein n=1 Tax=Sparus aurata TaxID=8175 RepID=A0A671YVL4_SPAAU